KMYYGLFMMGLMVGPSPADVDLTTLPRRESTQLTIYNSEDITMVREQRMLTVKAGVNRIQFSWANTLIDPTSIDFRLLSHQDQVDLLDTTFPAGRNDALQWNIASRIDGQVSVEIRYFTSGITWAADYVGIANEDETRMDLTGYVRVYNNSGELYDRAQTRMVVGTINLVEPIADLAQRPPVPVTTTATRRKAQEVLKKRAVAYQIAKSKSNLPASGLIPDQAKSVKKQGLSEYFLFTIDGREDIKNKEPKRLVSMEIDDVPLEVMYKLTDRQRGHGFTKYYRFKNRKLLNDDGAEVDLPDMENLGVSPLPDGEVRLFSEYENKDLAYVGGTKVKYVPIGDRVEVNVGMDRDITLVRRLKNKTTTNVKSREYKRRLDNTYVLYYDLIDYDETYSYEEEIVSGKSVLAKTEVERRFGDNIVLWGNGPKPDDWNADRAGTFVDLHEHEGKIEKVDANHVKYFLDLKPGRKRFVHYSVTYKKRKVGPEINTRKVKEPIQ
ncbi:MAG: hypothetical protein AAF492_12035, partial [Verrucomicrobiota bacterium]